MMMKIFISWSGETSHKIAIALRDWLPALVYDAETWVSSEDILKGERWGVELAKQLSETSCGIICIDPTNVQSPWLNFEAGALSKSIEHGKIFPLLFRISPNDLRGPLSQFQVTTFDKDDLYKLIRSLNQVTGTSKIPPDRLYKTFEMALPGLLSTIKEINIHQPKAQSNEKIIETGIKEPETQLGIPDSDILILKILVPSDQLVLQRKVESEKAG